MHYYQFNIGDYSSHTTHLSEMEDLAYRRMLDLYYLREKCLPDSIDEIARLVRMRTHSECIAIVLREFFKLESDGYHHARVDSEILAYQDKRNKASKAANSRWNKNNDLADADALQTDSERNANHKPITNNQETVKDNSANAQNSVIQKDSFPLQETLDAYHEILSMMPAVQVFNDKRKAMVRTFWKRRKAEYKKLGKDYSIDNLKVYFAYIAQNCRWMHEDRDNGKGGFWKAKNFDYVMKDDCYVGVKEQRFDDARAGQ